MKKYYRLLVIFLVLSCWIPHIVSAQIINVPDPNLAAALRGTLGLAPNAPITRQDMQRLTGLEAINRQIRDLTGLQHATQLIVLDLGANQISDIRPLAGLTRLGALSLAENRIQDVSPLAGMRQLEWLFLWSNQIRDIRPLAGMTQLERLLLGANQIRDVSPLAGLSQLVRLALNNNQIRDIRPLARLTHLGWLFLEVNQISDVSSLAGLTRLRELWLNQNNIRDVSPLTKLVNLERLKLDGNPIQDTSPLASLKKLTDVDVRITAPPTPPASKDLVPDPNLAAAVRGALRLAPNAPITKQAMKRLIILDANNRRITNLTGLEHATQLRELYLHENKIRNINPLTGLTQLEGLGLNRNQIRDVSPLSSLTQLEEIGLASNQIRDVRPFAALTQLRLLSLSRNQIRDVRPFAGLTRLTHLFLENNQIRDVTPLSGLVNLIQLHLAGNPITDTSPLASLPKLIEVDVRITAPPTPPRPTEPKPDPPRGTDLVPDAGLAAAVRRALGLAPNATITKQTLQRLKALEALNRQITDLTGLENATQLERLELNLNRIQDVSPLAGLTQLVALNLSFNQIQDVSPLAGLTQLVALNLSENQVQDVNPLVRLTRLERLYLNLNQIQDVSPLARMTRLMELGLAQNEIRDVSPLTRLVNLKKLWLVGNPITDTSPLASLPKLATVDVEITEPVVQVEATQHPPMYWIDTITGTLHRLVNAEIENLAPNVRNATYIAIDVANEKVYWTEEMGDNTGRIRRANLDGTNVRLVVNLRTAPPHSMALDTAAGKIYITNGWGKIQRLNIDGSNFEPNLITELDAPGGLILDVAGGKIYWTEKTGRIRRANLDGSHIQDIATGLANPLNIATSGDTIYWTEKTGENSGEIRFVNLLGTSNVRTRHSFSQDFPVGLAVDAVEKKLYWTTSRGNIGRSNFDGSNFQPNFVTSLIAPGAFALHVEPKVDTGVSVDASVDVLIYTGDVWWITRSEAIAEAETTKRRLQSAGIQAEITDNENTVKQWMLQTASDGSVDVLILYGLIPTTIYPPGNTMPDGSVAENWIETRDGNTILNHADYFGYWSTGNINQDGQVGVQNGHGTLQNLMDIPSIAIPVDGANIPMFVTADGNGLTPSLVNFQSDRPFPLYQFQGDWFAEKVFASNTGDARATLADPIIVRDGDRGRIAIVHQTLLENNPKGEVAAEIIINYLFVDAVVSISPSSIPSPVIGDQLTFNLNITAGEAVAGYQGTVQFDPTALRYVESNNGDYLPAGAFFVPPVVNGNRVKLASTVLTGVSNGDGTLATLTFEVIAAKASGLSLSDVLLSNSEGDTVSPQVAGGQVTAPAKLAGDVNSDGVVNIQDLVLVASNFGQTGATAADVNGDGVVNITDLVKVAGALGNAAAAPSLSRQALAMFTTADVRQWLAQAQHLDLTDATSQRGIRFLEQLLTALIPKESALLPNYPNPFNPETWIPYQLAKSTDVTITIYAMNGQIVRQLSLGHQLAGTYQNRSRAAYWDGRNTLDEPVASGVYFYTLSADDFTATGKMLIKK